MSSCLSFLLSIGPLAEFRQHACDFICLPLPFLMSFHPALYLVDRHEILERGPHFLFSQLQKL